MPLYKGTTEIASGKLYKGTTEIDTLYKGTSLIYQLGFSLRFLGIAGGSDGVALDSNSYYGGGGGAGEYLEVTGLIGEPGKNYQVIVGAASGGDTRFRTNDTQSNTFDYELSGSSGNGGRSWPSGFPASWAGYSATLNEAAAGSRGFSGGNGLWMSSLPGSPNGGLGGGGGGAGGAGGNTSANVYAGNGGPGYASDITGTSVIRAGGGGGAGQLTGTSSGYQSSGGSGGGGNGAVQEYQDSSIVAYPTNGAPNTGSGGGAGCYGGGNGTGGSGVVILRYPNTITINVGSSLTSTTTTTGTDKVTTFTAGSDNISFT